MLGGAAGDSAKSLRSSHTGLYNQRDAGRRTEAEGYEPAFNPRLSMLLPLGPRTRAGEKEEGAAGGRLIRSSGHELSPCRVENGSNDPAFQHSCGREVLEGSWAQRAALEGSANEVGPLGGSVEVADEVGGWGGGWGGGGGVVAVRGWGGEGASCPLTERGIVRALEQMQAQVCLPFPLRPSWSLFSPEAGQSRTRSSHSKLHGKWPSRCKYE